MNNLTLLIICIFTITSAHAQRLNRDPEQIVTGTGFLQTKVAPSSIVGDYNLFDENKTADLILLAGKKIESIPLNYDVYNSQFLTQFDKAIFSIDINEVEFMILKSTKQEYINSSLLEGTEPNFLLKTLFKSKSLALYETKEIEIIEPNYNRALDVGTRDTQIKKKSLYFLYDIVAQKSTKFKKPKKFVKTLDKQSELKNYIKENDLKIDQTEDLISLIRFYEKINFS